MNLVVHQVPYDSGSCDRDVSRSFQPPCVRVGSPAVVEAELVQHRRVHLGDANAINDRAIAEVVRLAIDPTGLEAAAGKPDGERVAVVVTAVVALRRRQAAELASPHHDGFVEHAPCVQVLYERSGPLIGLGCDLGQSLPELVVVVPRLARAGRHLNEAHTGLDQSPRHKAAQPVRTANLIVYPIQLLGFGRLACYVKDIHGLDLHAGCQLEIPDARLEFGLAGPSVEVKLVDAGQVFQALFLHAWRLLCGWLEVVNGRAAHVELDALVERWQKAVGPKQPAPDRVPLRVAQDHVCGKVLVFCAECVTDPCAHGRPTREDLAGQQHVQALGVVVVLGVHRADEAELVNDFGLMRQGFRDVHPAFPPLLKFEGRRQQCVCVAGLVNLYAVWMGLAGVLGEHGLRVEQIHLAGPAVLD